MCLAKSYSKFDSEVIVEDGNKPTFCGVNLADRAGLRTTRQTRLDEYLVTDNETDDSRVKLYKDTFRSLIDNAVSYITKRFQPFEEEPLVWFKVFDTDKWLSDLNSIKSVGNREIAKLLRYYHTNEYLTSDEREAALSEWGILKVEVLQRKQLNKDLRPYELFQSLLRTPDLKEEI